MKTKELIRRLQAEDPSGEGECCVGNSDIGSIYSEVAYWDGCLQVLKRDEANEYYNVIGAKYVASGYKVVIRPLSIDSAIFEDANLPVEYEGLSEQAVERYQKQVQATRDRTIKICNDVSRESFVAYMIQRLFNYNYSDDFTKEEITAAAQEFYDNNLNYDDPMPEDILKTRTNIEIAGEPYVSIPSWNDRRKAQWDREVAVDFKDGKLILKGIK